MRRATAISVRIYGLVARTFPEEFRALHGRELLETSGDLIEDVAARQGLTGLLALMLRILADLIARVVSEHVSSFGRDTRYALRVLKGSPAFTLTAVISVGLGIGIATSVYGQLNSMIFSPVPGVSQPESLVATAGTVSFPVYEAFVAQESPFLSAAAFIGTVPLAWSEIADRPSTRLWGEVVTSNYFEVLGTPMRVGGGLSSADLRADAVVLSERFWDRELNRDPGVVGDAIRLNGKLLTVAGVAAEGFLGARPLTGSADAWIPITNDLSIVPEVDRDTFENASHKPFAVVGRIKQGVGIDEAEVQLDTIAKRFEQPSALNEIQNRVRTVALIHGGRRLPISDRDLPFVIAVPGVLVLLMLGIACANVGTLLLAKTARRRREVALRLALGASRFRILRQVLIESLLVGLVAGVVGYAIARTYGMGLDSRTEVDLAKTNYLNMQLFELDWTALIFTSAVSIGSALMFGLAPALHAMRAPVADSLRAGPTWKLAGFRWFSFRNLLVLQQVVGSLALLLITGFVVQGITRNATIDPLLDTRGLFMTSLDPVRDGYSPDRAERLLKGLPQRIRSLPGVVDAALSFDVPIGPLSSGTAVRVRNTGFDEVAAQLQTARTSSVGPGFLETLGLPILAGRTLEEQDQLPGRAVANETLAAQMWPDQNAVGQTLEIEEQRFEIIGVVADLHPGGMLASTQPTLFRAFSVEDYARPGPFGLTLRSPW